MAPDLGGYCEFRIFRLAVIDYLGLEGLLKHLDSFLWGLRRLASTHHCYFLTLSFCVHVGQNVCSSLL
jgi:hypothetical protein